MIHIDADIDVEAVAASVRSCPAVSDLSTAAPDQESGPLAITYDDTTINISVIAFSGHRLSAVIDQVEAAVRPVIGTRYLTLTVDDLDTAHGPDFDR